MPIYEKIRHLAQYRKILMKFQIADWIKDVRMSHPYSHLVSFEKIYRNTMQPLVDLHA